MRTTAAILLVVLAFGALAPRALAAKSDSIYTPENIQASQDYVLKVVVPAIDATIADPDCPPAVTAGVKSLYQAITVGRVHVQPTPGFDGSKENENLMSLVDGPNGPLLLLYTDAIAKVEKKQKARDLGLILAVFMAHEALHLEDPPGLSSEAREARVWGIVLKQMVKPAIAKGYKLPSAFHQALRVFQSSEVSEDAENPAWTKAFTGYNDSLAWAH